MLWLIGGTILTPELTTDQPVIAGVQLLLALATFSGRCSRWSGWAFWGRMWFCRQLCAFACLATLDYVFFIAPRRLFCAVRAESSQAGILAD
ncbi:MAG: hypothetical protein R3E89_14280 [Thiolinea sp.]